MNTKTVLCFAVVFVLSVCSVTSQYAGGCGGTALGSPYGPPPCAPIIIRSGDNDGGNDLLFPILLLLLLGGNGGLGGGCF